MTIATPDLLLLFILILIVAVKILVGRYRHTWRYLVQPAAYLFCEYIFHLVKVVIRARHLDLFIILVIGFFCGQPAVRCMITHAPP